MEFLPLPFHLFIHFALAATAGYVVGRKFNKPEVGILCGIAGGFFIDLDHVLEYLLVFGFHFDVVEFFNGHQYLTSGTIRNFFHAWEYVPVLLALAWLVRKNKTAATVILALTLGGAVHLATDSIVNNYPLQNYSLIYRYQAGFQAENLLNEAQYRKFLEDRRYFGL